MLPSGLRRLDRRAGRSLYRSPSPNWVDDALIWTSSAAASGPFWFAVTGLVALTGRRGRRAALRGALTLGLSSLSVNLVAKRLIRARRPVAQGLRHRLLRVRTPSSPAFPSGHSATAAALAVGAAAASPRRGVALGALALLVSYSRLHVGAHTLTDVIAGNAFGAAVGVLLYLLRRPSHDGPDAQGAPSG